MTGNRLFIFWDNSNIFIPARTVAAPREPFANPRAVRIHFENLLQLVRVGRKIEFGVVVGTVQPELRDLWSKLGQTGLKVEMYERGAYSGDEQGVDQCLQVHMLRALADNEPGIAILLTGDGKGYNEGVGFHADLERMSRKGWGIELYSWEHACSRRLQSWAKKVGVYVPLDDYYDQITFMKQRRQANPIIRRRHPIAVARRENPRTAA